MRDELLAALSQYGSPALFVVAAAASVGLPLPVALLLIVTGSLIAQGVMDAWWAIGLACAGSVAGDLTGYAVGRWGGGRLLQRFSRLLGGEERLNRAKARVRSWGWAGVFFTRWLLTPLGPWVNLASGISRYPWGRFVLWDVLGECLCVLIYVTLGQIFSDRVMSLDSLLGELTWATVALLATALLGWKLASLFRRAT
ncbi:MAG: DedA family protein [Bryobacteraceae bacterium]|jgi:membrane protein DedA with SNARE-associated domain